MPIKVVAILLLFYGSCFAKSLDVSFPHKSYKLDYSKEKVNFVMEEKRYLFLKKDCNKGIILSFHRYVEQLLSSTPLQKQKSENMTIELTYEGEKYYTKKESKLGRGLILIPGELRRMKIEEGLKCSKSNQ